MFYVPQMNAGGRRRDRIRAIVVLGSWLLLGIVSLGSGTVSHLLDAHTDAWGEPHRHDFWESLYRTIQLFYLKDHDDHPSDFLYQIARFGAALVFFFPVVVLMLGMFAGVFYDLRLWILRGHVVVIGLGRHGNRFAAVYREQRIPVVVLEKEAENEHLPAARDAGAYVVIGNALDRSRLIAARVHRARRVVVQTASDEIDLAIIAEIEQLLRDRPRPEPLPVTMMVSSTGALRTLQLSSLRRKAHPLERSFFSIRELTAQKIIGHEAFRKGALEHDTPHLLIVGYGLLGEELLETVAKNLPDGKRMRVTVIGEGVRTAGELDLRRLPYLLEKLTVTFHDHAFDALGFDTELAVTEAVRAATVAVVLEENETARLDRALEVNHWRHVHRRTFPVFCLIDPRVVREVGYVRDEADGDAVVAIDVLENVVDREMIESGQLIEGIAEGMCRNWTAAHTPPPPPRRGFLARLFRGRPSAPLPMYPAGEWAALSPAARLVWRKRAEKFVRCLEEQDLRVQRRQSREPIRELDDDTAGKLTEAIAAATGRTLPGNWRTDRRWDAAGMVAEVRQWPTLLMAFGFEVIERHRAAPVTGLTSYPLSPAPTGESTA